MRPSPALIKADPGLPRLREALLAHRDRMRERVRAALEGQQWSVLQLYLALWPRTIEDAETLAGPVEKFARSALKKRWSKVADSGERLDDLTVEQRHEMRKALKTLRYAAEFFASLYPEASTRPFIKEIAQPAGGVRLSQRRRRRRAAGRHLPRRLRATAARPSAPPATCSAGTTPRPPMPGRTPTRAGRSSTRCRGSGRRARPVPQLGDETGMSSRAYARDPSCRCSGAC